MKVSGNFQVEFKGRLIDHYVTRIELAMFAYLIRHMPMRLKLILRKY